MAAESSPLIEKTGPICRLTLNRPHVLNAIDRDLGDRLLAAIEDCAEDPDVRAIVLAGAGRAFSAGDDIKPGAQEPPPGRPTRGRDFETSLRAANYFKFVRALRTSPKPIVARVQGYAYGAGLDLVLASDIAIAANDAKLAAVFVKSGIIGGTAQLPRYAGIKKAMEMLITGEPVAAPQAEALGLINYAVPPAELDATVDAWAAKLAAGPTRLIATIKLAVYRGLDGSYDAAEVVGAAATAEGNRYEDSREGRTAFAEKRPPLFRGR
jgi:2-(1,2-epoxy-1,2-dihydrophenyl)acetyl-CoA isomerase